MARRLLLATTLVLLASPVASAAARAREPFAFGPGPIPQRPFAGPMRDRVLPVRTALRAASVRASSAPVAYATREGYSVVVRFSSAYVADPVRAQAVVNFLDARLHGPELGHLSIFIAAPAEMATLCGPQALACYDPHAHEMTVPGDQTAANQPSLQYVVTHEYGHHIAAFRSNFPWSASRWGPKHWSTLQGVCPGVAVGRYYPGDEGDHYFDNPGEAWAESYAQYAFPGVTAWRWTDFVAPNAAVFGAVRVDVEAPWTRARRVTYRVRFHPGGHNVRTFRLSTALDGWVKATVSKPRGMRLQVVHHGLITDHVARSTLFAYDCGTRSLRFRVQRRGGAHGLVKLRVSYPQ